MTRAMKIAIVDDEQDMRQSISQWLALSGFDTETFASAEDALKAHRRRTSRASSSPTSRCRAWTGWHFLKRLMSMDSALPVIMITGHGDVPMAVEAMRVGAYDFLEKPFNPDRMTELAKRATQMRRLTLDNRALRRELSDGTVLMKKLIGTSPVMERLREDILDLGQADGHVLIDGETGTGKTLVAHALHAVGPRAGRKFVALSCAAYAEDTLGHPPVRPDRRGRRPAAGRGGARRHAVPGGYRGAQPGAAGAAADLHQRPGQPGRDPDRRDLQRPRAGQDGRGRAAPRPLSTASPR